MGKRLVVKIDEDKCDGCGLCIPNCAEGALKIIDGKARLVSEILCDGFGACLGHCPQGAITMEEREAEEYDEEAVKEHLATMEHDGAQEVEQSNASGLHQAHSCPGSMSRDLAAPAGHAEFVDVEPLEMKSQLQNWPVQLHLLNPAAPYLAKANLLLCADCVPFAYADFHRKFVKDHVVTIACPKLDNVDPYVHKIATIIRESDLKSLKIVIMEVPCCGGLVRIAAQALELAKSNLPVSLVQIGVRGQILEERQVRLRMKSA